MTLTERFLPTSKNAAKLRPIRSQFTNLPFLPLSPPTTRPFPYGPFEVSNGQVQSGAWILICAKRPLAKPSHT